MSISESRISLAQTTSLISLRPSLVQGPFGAGFSLAGRAQVGNTGIANSTALAERLPRLDARFPLGLVGAPPGALAGRAVLQRESVLSVAVLLRIRGVRAVLQRVLALFVAGVGAHCSGSRRSLERESALTWQSRRCL